MSKLSDFLSKPASVVTDAAYSAVALVVITVAARLLLDLPVLTLVPFADQVSGMIGGIGALMFYRRARSNLNNPPPPWRVRDDE